MDPLAFLNSELAPFIPGLNAFTLPIVLSAAALSKSSGVDEKVGQKSPHGGDVYYAGKDYGYQSPASYKKATGEYPEGYDIELGKKELRGGKPVFYAGKDYGYQSPEGYASVTGNLPPGYVPPTEEQTEEAASTGTSGERGGKLEGEGAKQEQEPVVDSTEKLLEKLTSREFQEDISRTKTRNLIEAATVLSALRAPRERQKQQAEIERQNIQAWRDIRTSQIEANARQQMALGLATVSALTPNMSNFAEIYKASQAPFNSRPSRS